MEIFQFRWWWYMKGLPWDIESSVELIKIPAAERKEEYGTWEEWKAETGQKIYVSGFSQPIYRFRHPAHKMLKVDIVFLDKHRKMIHEEFLWWNFECLGKDIHEKISSPPSVNYKNT